jgi:FkbM family methyltransferase
MGQPPQVAELSRHITEAHLALQFYPGYAETDLAIFAEFDTHPQPERGFVIDCVGSRTRVASLWPELRERLDGQVTQAPVPGDWHAEAIEWIGLLKAVRAARGSWVSMELGAGFGPWVVAGGVAARTRGVEDIRLTAVEADPLHCALLRTHFEDNGFAPDEHCVMRAAVGVNNGSAEWPDVDESSRSDAYAFRPITAGGDDYMGREFKRITVPVIAMQDLVKAEAHWNLVHIDVQGHEFAICESAIVVLNERVDWVIIGSHSRLIEGQLIELFASHGWHLEHEKPCRFDFRPHPPSLEAMTTQDGTQVWRNPRA